MSELSKKKCVPCEGGVEPLSEEKVDELLKELEGWSLNDAKHLFKRFEFKDFKSSLEFVNKVGEVAENENHHPNIEFTWGVVKISIYTHAINGLSENDFILAAKIDEI